jgi:hypothetical protein
MRTRLVTTTRRLQNIHHRVNSDRRLQQLPCIWRFPAVRVRTRIVGFGKTADILPTRLTIIVGNGTHAHASEEAIRSLAAVILDAFPRMRGCELPLAMRIAALAQCLTGDIVWV